MRGHITQKPNGSYRLVVSLGKVDGRYRQATKTLRCSKEQAERELRKMIREVEAGQLRRQETVGELLDAWLPRQTLARRTKADYGRVIEQYLRPAFGDWKVEALRAVDLDQLYDQLGKRVGPARIHRVHTVISGALQQAVKWQWIAYNPALHASPPPVPAPEIVLPTPGALPRMLEHADDELATFIRLGVNTGARAGELCGLRWPDLNGADLRIERAIEEVKGYLGHKETKTGKARTIAIDKPTVAALRSHRVRAKETALAWGVEWDDDSYMFRSWPDDKPWRPNVASQRFSALRDELGYSDFTVHSLRHQMATTLLSEGVDPATIAGRGGWANAATFLRYYAHFVPAKDQAAAEMMGRVLR